MTHSSQGSPLNIDDLSPHTLHKLLAQLYPKAKVSKVTVASRAACGDGLASTADRITLDVQYSESEKLPSRIILKTLLLHRLVRLGLPAILSLSAVIRLIKHVPILGGIGERALFSLIGVFQKHFPQAPDAMYEIESRFYSEIRPTLEIEAPEVFGALYDNQSRHFAILMEDLSAKDAHFPNATETQTLHTMKSVLSAMAILHARYWNSSELEGSLTWVPTRFEDGMFPVFDGIGFDLIRYQVESNQFKKDIIGPIGKTVQELWDGMWRSQHLLEIGPKTLLHGDTHVGNTYVLPNGDGGLLDFQLLVKGNPLIDVAYYIITGLSSEERNTHEQALIQHYLDELKANGVDAPSMTSANRDYRLASLWGLVIGWLITPPVNYGVEITSANVQRTTQAVIDLKAFSLIDGV
jgi:hypothetical protein